MHLDGDSLEQALWGHVAEFSKSPQCVGDSLGPEAGHDADSLVGQLIEQIVLRVV